MLPVNSSLVELHLGKMGLTDTGMERLSEGLKLNHRLRYLDLRWYKPGPHVFTHRQVFIITSPDFLKFLTVFPPIISSFT